MGATIVFYKRNPATGQMEQDRVPVRFEDDPANSGFEKAKRAGAKWQMRGAADHNYEVFRDKHSQ